MYGEDDVKLGKLLGSGNFASTYKAMLKKTQTTVALKKPKNEEASEEYKEEMKMLMVLCMSYKPTF